MLNIYRDNRVTHDYQMLIQSFEIALDEALYYLPDPALWDAIWAAERDCGSEADDIRFEVSRNHLYENGRLQR